MAGSEPQIEIAEVRPGDARFESVLELADAVLDQRRYLTADHAHASESHVLGAFVEQRCVGFVRSLVQVIGAEEGRSPITRDEQPLREGYVEAFGVDPVRRRARIGTVLQGHAIDHCRRAGCYQMRSRSPHTSVENHALKVAAGYVVSPSEQNDSYYFMLKL